MRRSLSRMPTRAAPKGERTMSQSNAVVSANATSTR